MHVCRYKLLVCRRSITIERYRTKDFPFIILIHSLVSMKRYPRLFSRRNLEIRIHNFSPNKWINLSRSIIQFPRPFSVLIRIYRRLLSFFFYNTITEAANWIWPIKWNYTCLQHPSCIYKTTIQNKCTKKISLSLSLYFSSQQWSRAISWDLSLSIVRIQMGKQQGLRKPRERRPRTAVKDVEADKEDGRWTIKRRRRCSRRLPIVINVESVSLRAYYPTRSN